jgi:4-oxalocrotonate tautomerase
MIEKVTDAVVETEGIPVRPVVVVNILEVPDGGWGSGGKPLTLADIQAAYRK